MAESGDPTVPVGGGGQEGEGGEDLRGEAAQTGKSAKKVTQDFGTSLQPVRLGGIPTSAPAH